MPHGLMSGDGERRRSPSASPPDSPATGAIALAGEEETPAEKALREQLVVLRAQVAEHHKRVLARNAAQAQAQLREQERAELQRLLQRERRQKQRPPPPPPSCVCGRRSEEQPRRPARETALSPSALSASAFSQAPLGRTGRHQARRQMVRAAEQPQESVL